MLYDISSVTTGLLSLVENAWDDAPIWSELGLGAPAFTPTFGGFSPDVAKLNGTPAAGSTQRLPTQLGLYLFHAEPNPTQEGQFWAPQMLNAAESPISYMPLALDLYYLLYAFSMSSWVEEQQALSVAMRVLHSNPIVASDASDNPAWSLTLTMQRMQALPAPPDALTIAWQSPTWALRMTVPYRAAVVFIAPDEAPPPAAQVLTLNAGVNDTDTVTLKSTDPVVVSP